jgi:hypothetical protein
MALPFGEGRTADEPCRSGCTDMTMGYDTGCNWRPDLHGTVSGQIVDVESSAGGMVREASGMPFNRR